MIVRQSQSVRDLETETKMNFNLFYEPVWADLLDREDGYSSDDDQHLHRERRQYKMRNRIELGHWDDFDFQYRFRMSKESFNIVLGLIEPKLAYENPR